MAQSTRDRSPAATDPVPPTDLPRPPRWMVQLLVVLTLASGTWYVQWRYTSSINWDVWFYALLLLAAETYSYANAWLFGLTVFRLKRRGEPPRPSSSATVDVFIACYNEPVELVRATALAAKAVRWPHQTYVLDDGNSPAMREMAESVGVGYITRSQEWEGKARHAKAGNVNNALERTNGEFVMILDSDQQPGPEILHRTLGYFRDPQVALVQTPQWFYNVPKGDPFGSQALLFYGPIQEGKDGWNAAFFCGSNAVLRREALLQIGIRDFVRTVEKRVDGALAGANLALARVAAQVDRSSGAAREMSPEAQLAARRALVVLRDAVDEAKSERRVGVPVQEVTFEFQRRTSEVASVLHDVEPVRDLLVAMDVSRPDEAQPVMPLSTISITEDMATSMRLHAAGFRSVYHDEILARGLAPEDLPSALTQRLRWAQGTLQVWLRENPLRQKGLSLGQRLMYFGTVASYLSGFATVMYLLAPIVYLYFDVLPVRSLSAAFWVHLLPYLILNQLLFLVVGWRRHPWRGQQYSLALFPLWIRAVFSTIGNVFRGRTLGFAVTPKTRQAYGTQFSAVKWQVAFMVALCSAVAYGLIGLWIGLRQDELAVWVNIAWVAYDLAVLGIVVIAATQSPRPGPGSEAIADSIRIGAGRM